MKRTLLDQISLISHFFNSTGIDRDIDDVLSLDNLGSYYSMYMQYIREMKKFTELTKVYNHIDFSFPYHSTNELKEVKDNVYQRLRTIARTLNTMGFNPRIFDGRTNCHILYTRLVR